MTDSRDEAKRLKHAATAAMQAAIANEIRMNRSALAADVQAATYDLNFATDLRMTFGVALKRAITELDRIGHDETEETCDRMAALRMSGDLSARGLEAFAKMAGANNVVDAPRESVDDGVSRAEKVAILRAQLRVAK